MRSAIFKIWGVFVVICSISGCASSLVYSPSLNLPPSPLKKEQGQIIAGGMLLPETRPKAAGSSTTYGADASIRYAFSDQFTFGFKAWADIEDLSDIWRGGVALHSIIAVGSPENNFKYGIIPTIAFLNNGESFDGGGGSIAFSTWFPKIGVVTPYTAIGPAIGVRNSSEWGYGAIANVGASMEIFKNFTLNAEVAGIIQVNQYDNITHGIVSPSVSLGWIF